MTNKWTYTYNGTEIVVTNGIDGTGLFVNGELQDEKNGLSLSTDLEGKLPTGEKVKASLGGMFTLKCSLFIDNKLQEPIEIL